MAWIKIINETNADGRLAEIYRDMIRRRGKLSNIMRIHSLNPPSMQAHMDLYLSVMFQRSGVKRPEREMLAVVVSGLNNCSYCVNHHAEALNFYWKDRERVNRFVADYRQADISPRQMAMLDHAVKLTRNPGEMSESHLQPLRDAGFSDADILDITLIVSYFNFVNRMANGLGVDFSEDEVRGYQY